MNRRGIILWWFGIGFRRMKERFVAVGQTLSGGLVELVAARKGFVTIIFHAMKPPTKKVLLELGLIRRKR